MPDPVYQRGAPAKKRKRRIVADDQRKKVSRACNHCKKRKIKCNGILPCLGCVNRGISCTISEIDKRSLKGFRNVDSDDETPSRPSNADLDSFLTGPTSPQAGRVYKSGTAPRLGSRAPKSNPTVPNPNSKASVHSQTSTNKTKSANSNAQPMSKSFAKMSFPNIQSVNSPLVNASLAENTQTAIHASSQLSATFQADSSHSQSVSPPTPSIHSPNPHYIPTGTQYSSPDTKLNARMTSLVQPFGLPNSVSSTSSLPEDNSQSPHPFNLHLILSPANYPLPQLLTQSPKFHSSPLIKSRSPRDSSRTETSLCSGDSSHQPIKQSISHHTTIADWGKSPKNTLERDTTSRMLYDSAGNLRYIGESSVLTVISQCRYIYSAVIGKSNFTEDPQRFVIVDAPGMRSTRIPLQLPARTCTDLLVDLYESNFNQLHYVFNMKHFREKVVAAAYEDPLNFPSRKLCLLHLVLALGAMFKDRVSTGDTDNARSPSSTDLFDSGTCLLTNCIEDGNLWLVEAYYLLYFYHDALTRRNNAWINLGISIRYALSLGLNKRDINDSFVNADYTLHRRKLWRSIYINDRISSNLLGRSLGINDHEWDDIHSIPLHPVDHYRNPVETNRLLLQALFEHELFCVSVINGKIMQRVYTAKRVDIELAKACAMELKLWYTNLRPELSVQNILEPEKDRYGYYTNGTPLQLLHFTHLYGIILLTRPFYHYVILLELGLMANTSPTTLPVELLESFSAALLRASLLTIKLAEFSVDNNVNLVGSNHWSNHLLNAGLMVGVMVLVQVRAQGKPRMYDSLPRVSIATMDTCVRVLEVFSKRDLKAKRYAHIMREMTDAVRKAGARGANEQSAREIPAKSCARSGSVSSSSRPAPAAQSVLPTTGLAESLHDLVDFQFELTTYDVPIPHNSNHTPPEEVSPVDGNENISVTEDGKTPGDASGKAPENEIGNAAGNVTGGAPGNGNMNSLGNIHMSETETNPRASLFMQNNQLLEEAIPDTNTDFLDSFLHDLGFKGALNSFN